MRKAIIAAIVATALFAVGAFAAELTVNSEDVASGSDAVLECAEYVDIDFEDPVWNDSVDDWQVSSADVTFFDEVTDAPTVAEDCDGFMVRIAVDAGNLAALESTNSVMVENGQASGLEFSTTDVRAIVAASVLVDGEVLYANNVDPL
jgi:hypothetical protein